MSRTRIIAVRNDGFGTRMLGFLNALYLAEVYEQDFGFVWPELNEGEGFHVVPKPADVFAQAYLERFLVRDVDAAALPVVERNATSEKEIRALLQQNAAIGVVAYVPEDKPAWRGAPLPDCPRLWSSIEWSPRMQSVFDAAKSSVPQGAVGIHIRRGDLVYGPSRERLFQQKYVPLAWCRHAIAKELAAGHPVVAFCEDSSVIESFRKHFPDLHFAELSGDYSRFERDVFELASLAHCSRIVCRASGFSILASLIGGVKREDFTAPPGKADAVILEDIATFTADYPPLGEAKDLSWIAVEAADQLSVEGRDRLLARAALLDPTNLAYTYVRATAMARDQRLDDAERLVAALPELSRDFQEPLDLAGLRGRSILDFPRPSPGRYPHLAAFHLAQNRAQHSDDERRTTLARVVAASPHSVSLLCAYVDELIAQGAFNEALNALHAAFAGTHADRRLHARMSYVALRVGEFETAARHGKLALESGPHDERTRLNVAEALAGVKAVDEAKSLALAIDPARLGDADQISRLARLLRATGETARAQIVEKSWADRPLSVADPRATRARSVPRRSLGTRLFRAIRRRIKSLVGRGKAKVI